jgi:glycosyltransferase involved in cell wall biosynthesis
MGFEYTPGAYATADLTVWPFSAAPFGMVGLESMVMGTPVVASGFPASSVIAECRGGVVAAGRSLLDSVAAALSAPRLLAAFRVKSQAYLGERRRLFNDAWTDLVG